MRILVILDALDKLDLAGDTSYALMLEAARRSHEIWTCEIGHIGLEQDAPVAEAQPTKVQAAQTPAEAFACEPPSQIPIDAFDVVLMRKDPPLDMAYLHTTWLLERARGRTVLVNDPRGLRELNEHLSILDFPELIPPTIVTRSAQRLGRFLDEQDGAIVVKPIEGYAGLGIFLVKSGDPNTSSIFETATAGGREWTMAQAYLPAAVEGDKRIILVDGEPIGAILRVPPENEARGNLHVGGRAVKCELDDRDHEIIAAVAPMLTAYGQIFVGLDVIGGMLTEINITSPTGIRHLDSLEGRNSSAQVIDCLERKAAALR
ncbi:glutathione synthase [Haliangium sp.]|uniref:glutathione synthase n=1 Tax=Haliangium sp. TaxID=2663208 RepID=UPI003D11C430